MKYHRDKYLVKRKYGSGIVSEVCNVKLEKKQVKSIEPHVVSVGINDVLFAKYGIGAF